MYHDISIKAKQIRERILTLAYKKKSSHVGGALSVADILVYMYRHVLRYDPKNPAYPERDRFFYSKGHACLALYAVLEDSGFFTGDTLNGFTENGSYFTSHVNHKVPGVELSTGSLGHALSVACGVALAGKRKNAAWRVYCVLSDGELNEGSNWEAILFAAHHKLNNLTIIIDYNKIQSFGTTREVLDLDVGKPLLDKLDAFGWSVAQINGHSFEEIECAFASVKNAPKPQAIIAHTVKGKGVDFMENKLAWHYKSPNDEEYQNAIAQIRQAT
ncbi:MAG: transketolase [Chitinophagales bacterium]|nr:transketolase [Chitinophagales bacterium]